MTESGRATRPDLLRRADCDAVGDELAASAVRRRTTLPTEGREPGRARPPRSGGGRYGPRAGSSGEKSRATDGSLPRISSSGDVAVATWRPPSSVSATV